MTIEMVKEGLAFIPTTNGKVEEVLDLTDGQKKPFKLCGYLIRPCATEPPDGAGKVQIGEGVWLWWQGKLEAV